MNLISRYVAGVKDEGAWVAGAAVLSVVAAFTLFKALPERQRRWGYAVVTVLSMIGAVAWALHLGWVGDDAYISFRYVRNLVEGHGLVYNPGERVEGYTNFLWVIILAPFYALGLDLGQASIVLTLLCLVATLALVGLLVWRWSPEARKPTFPIASVVLATNYVFASYGTSGLETMLGALLVLLALERADRGAPLASGVFGILATMAHPDHAIFYASIAFALLFSPRRWRDLTRFAAPFVFLYVPYFAWRWAYYGDFFPNTYYAKNAHLFYFSQGFRYLGISGWSAGLWVALPAAIYGIVRFRHLTIAKFGVFAIPVFLFYVAKIGGDFMLGRLLCPLLPAVFILAELGIRALATLRRPWLRVVAVAAVVIVSTAVVPVRLIRPYEKYMHLADERTFYSVKTYIPLSINSIYWHWADSFNALFGSLSRKPTLAMGSLGIIGYRTQLRIVDNYGLVHRGVAHTRTRTRGRPGHEKMIGPGMLVQSDADFSDISVYPGEYDRHGLVRFAGVGMYTVRYDRNLFRELSRAGVAEPGIQRFIRDYRPPKGRDADPRLACDLWYMEQIYFQHNADANRREQLVKRVIAARPEWAGHEAFILREPSANDGWAEVERMSFEELAPGTEISGNAFAFNPVASESAGQGPPAGHVGRFINTFQEAEADEARGTLVTPEFEIRGDVITLEVGGGRYPNQEYVELLVDGERQFTATGCNTEILGRRIWPTAALKGRRARLRIVDDSQGGWGHILVDELVQWQRTGTLRAEAVQQPAPDSKPQVAPAATVADP